MTVQVKSVPNTPQRRRAVDIVPDRADNYVLEGADPRFQNGDLIVPSGEVTLADGGTVYQVVFDEHTFTPGSDGSVYVDVDTSAVTAELVAQSSPPSAPSLALANYDVSAEAVTPRNRDPSLTAGSLSTDELNNIRIADPSGGVASIQAEVDALPADGGTVKLPPGDYSTSTAIQSSGQSYDESVALLITKPNVTIQGSGWSSRIYLKANSTNGTDGARLIDVQAPNVILKDFQIDGQQEDGNKPTGTANDGHNIAIGRDSEQTQIAAPNCTVKNVWSHHSPGDGVEGFGDNLTVTGCHFNDCWEHDIQVRDASGVSVTGNLLDGEINGGMLAFYGFTPIRNVSITGNVLLNGDSVGISVGVADNGDAHNITISGNEVYETTNAAIKLIADNSAITDVTLGNNVAIGGSVAAQLRTEAGSISDVKISDSIFRDADRGLDFSASGGTIDRVSFTGNEVRNISNPAVRILPGEFEDIRITDNEFYQNPDQAMLLAGGSHLTIEDNTIVGAGLQGVKIDPSESMANIKILDNDFRDIHQSGTTNKAVAAVDIAQNSYSVDDILIRDNNLRAESGVDNSKHGVALRDNGGTGSVSNVKVVDNVFEAINNDPVLIEHPVYEVSGNRPAQPLASAPIGSYAGMVVTQDGSNWNPAGTGNAQLVQYVNGSWQAL